MNCRLLSAAIFLPWSLYAGDQPAPSPAPPSTVIDTAPLSEGWALDFDTSVLMKITNVTPLDYTVIAGSISLRTPERIHIDLADGAKIVVRDNITFLAEAFAEGAESYYFGFSGSPSIEFWPASERYNVYFAIGGGLGVVDSTAIEGGQGQDLTLNWFARAGLRYSVSENLALNIGIHFQHLSNGGMDDRNPGLNALGPSLGLSYRF